MEFKKDQVITNLDGLFWIRSGSICLFDLNNKEKDTYGPNEFIGVEKLSENKYTEEQAKSGNSMKISQMIKDKIDSKIIANEDVLCTIIPDFAFIEVFGIDFKMKLYISYFKETICINKTFQIIFDCNKTSNISQIFNLKEYKKKNI